MPPIAARTAPRPSPDNSMAETCPQIPDGIAAEAIPNAGTPCYIDTDGRIRVASGAAAGAAAKVRGFAYRPAAAGQPVTLLRTGSRFGWAAPGGFTPGADLFLGGAAGEISNTASTGGTAPIAFAVNDTDFMAL